MSRSRWMRYLAVMGAVAGLAACGDYTASTSPPQKKTNPTAPTGAVYSRYILISGAWMCVEDCEDSDPKADSPPADLDSLTVGGLPGGGGPASGPAVPDAP